MCGIAGIFAYSDRAPAVDPDELLAIRERMAARGPDGAGIWLDEDRRIGLAQRRLAIIDLSEHGAQPMLDADTGNQIVFNGEIFNYASLASELRQQGVTLRSDSDTEVLLKLYARHGAAMLDRLRGMYAIAIWDVRQRCLFLARDTFGIKPLYLANDGSSLRFASQVKALLRGRVDTAPEPAGHAGFLLWGSVPEPYTLYKGIRALPAGCWVTVTDRGAGPVNTFDSPGLRLQQAGRASFAEREAAMQSVAASVRDSVAAHMVADVPVGVFLSAGLDSTMIAACAAATGQLRTVTLGFDEYRGTVDDEVPLAGDVANLLGAKHSVDRLCAADFDADHDALLDAMDQPSIDGVNTWFVAKAAARQGLKVALSGIGGDELFGSYPSFHQVPRLRSATAALAAIPHLGTTLRRALSPWLHALASPKYAGVVEYGGSLEGAYLLRRALFMPWEISTLIDPEMAAAGLAELATVPSLRKTSGGLDSDRRIISALEMQWYMKNQLLRDADWAGMAHSLEIRVPFVDARLTSQFIEMAGLPASEEKRLIARTVAPQLPAALWSRPKTGFSIPTRRWIERRSGEAASSQRSWAKHVYAAFTGQPDVARPAMRDTST